MIQICETFQVTMSSNRKSKTVENLLTRKFLPNHFLDLLLSNDHLPLSSRLLNTNKQLELVIPLLSHVSTCVIFPNDDSIILYPYFTQ